MFQLIAFAVLAIGLFSSPFGVQADDSPLAQTRETVFECYSWGDPHIQTWYPKSATQIQKRDCYEEGDHFLLKNQFVTFKVHVNKKLTIEIDLKFHNEHSHDVCHIQIKRNNKTFGDYTCQTHGISYEITTVGAHSTYTIYYPAAQFLASIREAGNCPGSCYYNVYVWQPQYLLNQSIGICSAGDLGCSAKRSEAEWEPVRSASVRQFISTEQATTICNEYVDAFFARTVQSQYQRDARVNSVVTNVLAGCVDDLVLTGEVEMAEGSLDVLMMQALTEHATSIEAIQKSIGAGVEAASVMLNDVAKVARVAARRVL